MGIRGPSAEPHEHRGCGCGAWWGRNPHAFAGLPWIAKVKQGCVESRDAFVSARGLVKAVREGMGETQTPQTNLRNERGRGFGLMLIDPKRRGCTAKAQLMLETLI